MFANNQMENDFVLQGGDVLFVDRYPLFYIYGEVQRPGSYRVERGMTVVQALASGGGLTPRGTQRGVRVKRRDSKGQVVEMQPSLDDPIQPGRTGPMNPPAVFSHLAQSAGTLGRRREMDVRQFADGVAKTIIHLPGSPIPAMHMGDDQTAEVGSGSGGERLDPISDDQNNVRLKLSQRISQGGGGEARIAGRRFTIAARVGIPGNDRVDLPAIVLDGLNAIAVCGIQVHAGGDDL